MRINPNDCHNISCRRAETESDVLNALKDQDSNFERLLSQVAALMRLQMRETDKTNQTSRQAMHHEIEEYSNKIKESYNGWTAVASKIAIAAVGAIAGAAGALPFFNPGMAMAKELATFSTSIGTATSTLNPIPMIFDNASEATRGRLNTDLKRSQEREEELRGVKSRDKQTDDSARETVNASNRSAHEAKAAVMGG